VLDGNWKVEKNKKNNYEVDLFNVSYLLSYLWLKFPDRFSASPHFRNHPDHAIDTLRAVMTSSLLYLFS